MLMRLCRRYPFYMLGCFNTEWKTLTWLRYSLWMPLYPLGALAEGTFTFTCLKVEPKTKYKHVCHSPNSCRRGTVHSHLWQNQPVQHSSAKGYRHITELLQCPACAPRAHVSRQVCALEQNATSLKSNLKYLVHPFLQDFFSTFVISTSKGRGGSVPPRVRLIDASLLMRLCCLFVCAACLFEMVSFSQASYRGFLTSFPLLICPAPFRVYLHYQIQVFYNKLCVFSWCPSQVKVFCFFTVHTTHRVNMAKFEWS